MNKQFQEGQLAYLNNIPIEDTPYGAYGIATSDWQDGWAKMRNKVEKFKNKQKNYSKVE
jgi:hypothetical protein